MSEVVDEAILKLISLTLRFLQLAFSLTVVGCASQFIAYFSNADLDIPEAYVAVVAIASVTTLWSVVSFLLTCCAGKLLLGIETSLDLVSVGLSIANVVLARTDALSSKADFANRYSHWRGFVNYSDAQSLTRAVFALSILLVPLFASTSLMSWAVYWLRRKHEKRHHHHHHNHHNHHQFEHS